ncbi:glutathione S-transferase [Magnetofaba australis]|nr:glutathione S-transferase [Magnetofaba australis]
MQLYTSPTSPFGRKVVITLFERGLLEQTEVIVMNALDNPAALLQSNPLGKVPCLITDDNQAIYDSPLICAWLDNFSGDRGLWAGHGKPHWERHKRQSLADGLMEAAFLLVMERKRPDAEQSTLWMARWSDAIARGVAVLERDAEAIGQGGRVDQIAVGCALGYLDFRLPDLNWRSHAPRLTPWFAEYAQRPAMLATQPS